MRLLTAVVIVASVETLSLAGLAAFLFWSHHGNAAECAMFVLVYSVLASGGWLRRSAGVTEEAL